MKNRRRLLDLCQPEVLELAWRVIKKYPDASSSEKRDFLRDVDGWYGNTETEKALVKIAEYAKQRGDHELLRDVLMLQGECYFRKERPQQAIDYFARMEAEQAAELSADDLRQVQGYLAISHFWLGNQAKALELLRSLEATAPEAADATGETLWTKPFYGYMQAVALFEHRDYAQSKQAFERVVADYPESSWAKRSAEYLVHMAPLLDVGALSSKVAE